jgi:7-cyano-7-deazaguanine synthase in queuosine biosynthesis
MEKQTLVICLSGGLDSFTMFHYANRVFNQDNQYNIKYLIVIDKDSPYWEKEWNTILQLYKLPKDTTLDNRFNVVTLNGYGRLAKTDDHVILGRNAVIASIASALGENIWMGGTKFEDNIGMYDKNEMFWWKMSEALHQACGYKRKQDVYDPEFTYIQQLSTRVYSPFQGKQLAFAPAWDKHDMIVWLEKQDIKDWRNTVSCFHPTQLRCGKCAVCYKRYIYEKYVELTTDIRYTCNGFLEDTYVENPLDNFFLKQTVEKMKEAVKNKDYSRYHLERIKIYNEVLVNTGVLKQGELL